MSAIFLSYCFYVSVSYLQLLLYFYCYYILEKKVKISNRKRNLAISAAPHSLPFPDLQIPKTKNGQTIFQRTDLILTKNERNFGCAEKKRKYSNGIASADENADFVQFLILPTTIIIILLYLHFFILYILPSDQRTSARCSKKLF